MISVQRNDIMLWVCHCARYAISLHCRKRIEEIFGWGKTTGGLGQPAKP